MKRTALALALLAALTLSGCASAAPEPAATDVATVEVEPPGEVSETPAPAESVAPAPVEVTPTVAPEPTQEEKEAAFIVAAERWNLGLSDSEVLSAAAYACQELAAGNIDVVALQGAAETVNSQFVASAQVFFCPEAQP